MILIIFLCLLTNFTSAQDPRLEKDDLRECVENAKRILKSSEYFGKENEESLIGACRDVDPECVNVVADYYRPSDSREKEQVLELVRLCRGSGMGKCARGMSAKLASYDRREFSQLQTMLKKCK